MKRGWLGAMGQMFIKKTGEVLSAYRKGELDATEAIDLIAHDYEDKIDDLREVK